VIVSQSKGFIARHGLWDDKQTEAAQKLPGLIAEKGVKSIRVSVADPQGKLRTKTVFPNSLGSVLKNGLDFVSAQFHFDSAEAFAYNGFTKDGGLGLTEMAGFPDVVLVPDPLTFRVLPWAENCGWILGDMYFHSGEPVPFDARHKLKKALAELRSAGFDYLAGLEVEFYLMRVIGVHLSPEDLGTLGKPPTPPTVEAIGRGYAYQCEDHLDAIDGLINTLSRYCTELRLPLRTIEDEMGPGQIEFTFEPQSALNAADGMVLFRSMIKQVTARMGLHATFMACPGLANYCPSGWHLHQSLTNSKGENAFVAPEGSGKLLSDVGEYFVGGILEHASEASVFTTPTINGYKRRRAYSLAPDRATWGYDNRAAMCRVQGGPGDPSSHIENRIGEPSANPYLYIASQIAAGLDGVKRHLSPGPIEKDPYTATDRAPLPTTLMEAMERLGESKFYRDSFGDKFVDWLLGVKQSEVNRFVAAEPKWQENPDRVTDWEHREYFTRY
jgi:glutamine synthetase